ncbi:MAG: (d)CMP kinase [Firmicutes bacterium]|nr:(d)CMP kinase [Bacillota bacterium]
MKHSYLKGAKKLRPDIVKKNNKINIAIDGPAGSGKSTIAKNVAKILGILYADTGAMYRTVGLYCLKNDIDTNDEEAVSKKIDDIDIEVKFENGKQLIYLEKKDVTDKIRTQEVASAASNVAKIGKVREKLVEMQKKTAETQSIVMDGRDIGTHVLPNADVKIYMEADVEERAKRRCSELKEKGIEFDYEKIKEEIIQRDNADKNRKISPLRKADDAILIDTSSMSIEEVTKKVTDIIYAAEGRK